MRRFVLPICVSFLGSCFGGPTDFQKQDGSMRGGIANRIVTKTTEGVTYASIRADGESEQVFEVTDIEELAGSSFSIPPGALAVNVSMNVQEAAPLATTANAVNLQLGTGFTSTSAPMVVQADKSVDLLKPMTIALPLPASTQLMMADPYQNLVVLYKVAIAETDEIRIGAMLRGSLTISGNSVLFTTSYLGAYQVAITEKLVEKALELPTLAPIQTKKEEAKTLTVDVGYDKESTTADIALDARTTSAVSFQWEKISGTGAATFSAAAVEDTKVAFSKDGVYVLRLTITNEKGESARDEITVSYDPWSIANIVVSLVNAATDGTVDYTESTSTLPILSLSTPEAAKVAFSQPRPQTQACDASISYSEVSAPTASSLTADGSYVFCVAFENFGGKTYYANSPLITRNAVAPTPTFTSLALAGDGADGYVNALESGHATPLFTLMATSATSASYSAALSSSITCDSTQSYSVNSLPRAIDLPGTDGDYVFCVKLMNAAGESFGKSAVVTRDTVYPVFTSMTGLSEASNGVISGAETGSTSPIAVMTASGHDSVMFTTPLADSSLTCDASKTYNQAIIPAINTIPTIDGAYAVCAKLADTAGNVAYGKSSQIVRDTNGPSVDAGADIATNTMINIDALTSGGTTYAWSKQSGVGTVSFGSINAEDTTVSASADGTYVLRLTVTDTAGNSAFDELNFLWDTGDPIFTSLSSANEGSDGFINSSEMSSANPLWSLSASGYSSYLYTVPLDDTTPVVCDGSKSYTEVTIAGAMTLASDAPYVICVKLMDEANNETYGKSASITRDSVGPMLSAYNNQNAAMDGFVNQSESADTMPLWSDSSSGWVSAQFTSPLDDSGTTVVCDSTQTYSAPGVPTSTDLPYDGIWVGCIRLMDAAGNVTFGKSQSVTRDTTPPTLAFTSTPAANALTSTSVSVSGTCSENGLTLNLAGLISSSPASPTCAGGVWSALFNFATASEGNVSVTAQTMDPAGNMATTSAAFVKDTILPVAAVTYKFPDVTDKAQWNIAIATADTAYFKFKFGPDGGTSPCNSVSDYMGYQTVGTPLVMNLDGYLDGPMRLCVLAKDQVGNEQDLAVATTYTWEKLTKTPTVIQVAMGGTHACALFANGRIKCWGSNAQGQLGYGDTTDRESTGQMDDNLPYVDLGPGRAEQVVAGYMHTCALFQGGDVRCWGYNMYGQLGQGDTISRGDSPSNMGPNNLPPTILGGPALKLAAGSDHTCALMATHDVKCWGFNSQGQLGLGDTESRGDNSGEMTSLPFVSLGTGVKATDIATGVHGTCAILMDSTIKCWGRNSSDQLGSGATTIGSSPSDMGNNLLALNFGTGLKVRKVTLGLDHTCVVLWNEPNQVKCIGSGTYGRLGYESTVDTSISAVMGTATNTFVAISGVKELSAGAEHTCALLMDGQVKCWGLNATGQLGQGTVTNLGGASSDITALTPVDLGAGLRAVQISASFNSNCVLLDTSRVKCWGDNMSSQLGNTSMLGQNVGDNANEMGDYNTPVPTGTMGAPGTIKLYSGSNFSCALNDGYQLKCWGANTSGQLGVGNTTSLGSVPLQMGSYLQPINFGTGLKPVDVALGDLFACATFSDGQVKCWGGNTQGQLGIGSVINMGDGPGEMTALTSLNLGTGTGTPVKLIAGSAHACTLFASGKMKCWGSNSYGQLGQDNTNTTGDEPSEMADYLPFINLSGQLVVDIAAGGQSTCATLSDRTLKCWGYNTQGQLGIGTTTNMGESAGQMTSLSPVNFAGKRVAHLAMASNHSCVILEDRTVKCWGGNIYGQLGIGTVINQTLPVSVPLDAGKMPKTLALGLQQSCVQNMDRTVKCWGDNASGQLGQGNTTSQTSAAFAEATINLGEERTARAITARNQAVCALTDMGLVKCWGDNAATISLGTGTTVNYGSAPNEIGNWLPFVKLH